MGRYRRVATRQTTKFPDSSNHLRKSCIFYDKLVVGEFEADLVVEDCIILELKAVRLLLNEHEAQLLNYLNATGFEVGLLLNFGPQAQIRRKVFDNARKKYLNSRMDTN